MLRLSFFFSKLNKTKAYDMLMENQKKKIEQTEFYMNKLNTVESKQEMINLQKLMNEELRQFDAQKEQLIKDIQIEKKKNFDEHLKNMDVDPEDIKLLYKNKEKKQKKEDIIMEDKAKRKHEETKITPPEEQKFNVPKYLEIRNLKSPIRQQGHLILLGVKRHNAFHAQYVYDALFNLKPEVILTDLPVDDPFFIKTEDDYQQAWKQFIENQLETTFLINPYPSTFPDVHLHKNKINWIIENNLKKNPVVKINPTTICDIVQANNALREIEIIDILKTPFLFSYHHSTPIVINGYPEINYRYFIQENISIDELHQLLKQKDSAMDAGQRNFDPMLLKPALFIQPKIKFIVEIIKMTLMSYKNAVILVEANKVDQIEEEWIKSSHTQITTDLRQQIYPLSPLKKNEETIKKLVILDRLLSPFIYNNFVRYNCFPYQMSDHPGRLSLQQQWESLKQKISRQ